MDDSSQQIASDYDPSVFPASQARADNTSQTRADFEGLLELAEKLQQSSERHTSEYEGSALTLQGFQLLFALEAGVGCFVAMGFLGPAEANFSIRVAVSLLDVLAFVATFRYFRGVSLRLRQLRLLRQTDERDLTEVVELLREIEPVVAKQENLSMLDRVQIRIRLSRFGVGPSSSRDTNSNSKERGETFGARQKRTDQELLKPF